MICKLAPVGCGCKHVDEEGNCTTFYAEGVKRHMEIGKCYLRNIEAKPTGIYAPKKMMFGRVGQQKQKKGK